MYSFRKSRHILKDGCKWHKKQRHILAADQLQWFENALKQLDDFLLDKNRAKASELAAQVEAFCSAHFKKSIWMHFTELLFAIIVALVVATIVRQMWFELYEIPTGSMRPTFKEQDHLTVTKTVFGINVPLATNHFYFDPHLVQRTSVAIWSGEGVPHLDSNDTFMGIFPYTKRYIKRCMGKPGDTLYFYGGRIYGFDRDGNDLKELRDNSWTASLEYVPFTNFEGRAESKRTKTAPEIVFHYFNQGIGRYRLLNGTTKGEVFNGKTWVEDRPEAQSKPHTTIQTYSDFWGMRNFALARILDKDQLEKLTVYNIKELGEAPLYLELRHTPSLSFPPPLISERFGIAIKGYSTVIPLNEKHLRALMDHMYTCRFVVSDGVANSYRAGKVSARPTSPSFSNIADGTYEFYYGKGVEIKWGGINFDLPKTHPLCSDSPKNIQRLFNVGIEMSTVVEPNSRNQPYFPNRYAYFRDGDLYVMGGKIMDKDDPTLLNFNMREKKREASASSQQPYVAFRDYGPPLNSSGELDKEFIAAFGLRIPDEKYLMLGDNHAMSQDSRYFGPVPQNNLQGAPSLIIWPPGERWGIPNQRPYPLLNLPREIVWGIAATIGLVCFVIHRRNLKKRQFKP